MKAKSIGNKNERGSSILEIIIAVAILTLGISAATLLSFANQTLKVDSGTSGEALYKVKQVLEDARALSRQNFSAVVSTPATVDDIYTKKFDATDITPCRKEVTSKITWSTEKTRPQKIELRTDLADIAGTLALGGDCASDGPGGGPGGGGLTWDNPQPFATDTLNPGKPTAIDILNRIAYLGEDKDPYLAIADTRGTVLGQNSGLFVVFANGFTASAQINAIDAVKWIDPLTGAMKIYAYAAMDTAVNQLKVIDVTDIYKPVIVATRSLSPCVTGSYPEGWKLFYYNNRLYFTTRETAGPELHIFDVSSPTNPVEIGGGACKGTQLNDTVNSIAVRDQVIGASVRRFMYLATDENDRELRVFEVTGDTPVEVTTANQNFPGNQNGESVYLVGNTLYFGRASSPTGPELYVFDIANPLAGLAPLGSQDVGAGVIAIRVAGRFAFLATDKTNEEFQIWNVANLSSIVNIAKYNFGNIINGGIDYEPDYVYSTGSATPNFQMLYSP